MRNILLRISYDGTNFNGWQCQNSGRTVQKEIEKILFYIHKEPIKLYGSGRTDSGVHATGQAANFFSPIDTIPVENYISAINSHLPHDIRIHHAEEKPHDFNARFSAVNRTYRYFFHCDKSSPYAHHMPYIYPLYRYPNVQMLNDMALCLRGEIDCASFAASGDASRSTHRFIERVVFFMEGEHLVFEICASAFLWKMVRTLVGTLVGLEKKGGTVNDFREILVAKDRKKAGTTAPAHGLFLWNVEFSGTRIHP